MIVGLDCTRIPKSKDDRNFVMVSSYNESCSKYYTNIQKSCNNSQIAPAGPLLISALKKYETMRKQIHKEKSHGKKQNKKHSQHIKATSENNRRNTRKQKQQPLQKTF